MNHESFARISTEYRILLPLTSLIFLSCGWIAIASSVQQAIALKVEIQVIS
ncbi:hypothetical protein WKK05_20595 [Nostoc sp. UHCC 0302]|uniref:hypothetical protein n=1 Tax=Nostoc sp. UHCC 0302 TaxID=3134896 RepID=UPI00311CD505